MDDLVTYWSANILLVIHTPFPFHPLPIQLNVWKLLAEFLYYLYLHSVLRMRLGKKSLEGRRWEKVGPVLQIKEAIFRGVNGTSYLHHTANSNTSLILSPESFSRGESEKAFEFTVSVGQCRNFL